MLVTRAGFQNRHYRLRHAVAAYRGAVQASDERGATWATTTRALPLYANSLGALLAQAIMTGCLGLACFRLWRWLKGKQYSNTRIMLIALLAAVLVQALVIILVHAAGLDGG